MPPSDNPIARKSRDYRRRRRDGAVVVQLEIGSEIQNALLSAGLVDPDVPLDRAAIADGIWIILSFLIDGDLYFGAADAG